jgi:signal transduction histidine kinase
VGVFTDRDLRDKRLGPVSLKRRVAQSGGTISIDSSPTGAKVRITVPVERGS